MFRFYAYLVAPCSNLIYTLKDRTTRTMYCRQMGHSLSTLPQLIHVAIWPHSRITQLIGASMQILHRSSAASLSGAVEKNLTLAFIRIGEGKCTQLTGNGLVVEPQPQNPLAEFCLFTAAFKVYSVEHQDLFQLLHRKHVQVSAVEWRQVITRYWRLLKYVKNVVGRELQ